MLSTKCFEGLQLTFWSPRVVSSVQSKGTILLVPASSPYHADSLVTQLQVTQHQRSTNRLPYLLVTELRSLYHYWTPFYIDIPFICTLVFAGGRPNSNFLFLRMGTLLPPVARRLCQLFRAIPVRWMEIHQFHSLSLPQRVRCVSHQQRLRWKPTHPWSSNVRPSASKERT